MGERKTALSSAAVLTEAADEKVGPPAWLFQAVIHPFEEGAWESADTSSGMSVQCYDQLSSIRQTLEAQFSRQAVYAQELYSKCPQDE